MASLLLSPGSWCIQDFVCSFQESVSPVLCYLWWLCGRVNGNLFQDGLCHTQVCLTQRPYYCDRPLLTHTSAGDSVGSLGSGVYKVCLSPPSISGGYGFDSKCNFAPLPVLLGLLLCPWTWDIFFLVGSNILLSMVFSSKL